MKEAVLAAVAIGILGWFAALLWRHVVEVADRRRVHEWLSKNTRDYPGESHVDTATVAKGTAMPEERVRRACMTDPRVHRAAQEKELWSVWRQEPQSIYEVREPFVLG